MCRMWMPMPRNAQMYQPETKAGAIHDGREVTTIGDRLRVGHMPPWFELDAARSGKEKAAKIDIASLASKFILLSVPSLDTPVCDEEVKRFGDWQAMFRTTRSSSPQWIFLSL